MSNSPLLWVDTHCHINPMHINPTQEGFDEIMARANEQLAFMINIATTAEVNKSVLESTLMFPKMYGALGIHPKYPQEYTESLEAWIVKQVKAEGSKIVAIGEIGLDYFKSNEDAKTQRLAFQKQLALAQTLNLPVIIHNRNALDDCLSVLAEFPEVKRVIFHCFSGTVSEATRILNAGYGLSFTGIITFNKTEELQEVVRIMPLDKLLIETDCPYLAPVPYRGKNNEPAWVSFVGEKMAEIRSVSVQEMCAITTDNARRMFLSPNA